VKGPLDKFITQRSYQVAKYYEDGIEKEAIVPASESAGLPDS
jgi:hypothetical protein